MIVQHEEVINGKTFTVTESDSGYMIQRGPIDLGLLYEVAYDPAELEHIYYETRERREDYVPSEDDADESDLIDALREVGVEV